MRHGVWFLMVVGLAGCGEPGEEASQALADSHGGDRPVATALTAGPVAVDVTAQEVSYGTVEGNALRGYLARPQEIGDAPGLLVIHEWWGLNQNVRATTEQLASHGYVALAVDLYGGEVADTPERARSIMGSAMQRPELLEANLQQGLAYLQQTQQAARVASIGWCFGGGWSLRTALSAADRLQAAVMFYGPLIQDEQRLAHLDAPLLGIFGSDDRAIPPADVEAFAQRLGQLGKRFEIIIYQNADHAFANPSGTRYQAAAAEKAWAKTLDFLHRHLHQ